MSGPTMLGGLSARIVSVHEMLDSMHVQHQFGGAIALAWYRNPREPTRWPCFGSSPNDKRNDPRSRSRHRGAWTLSNVSPPSWRRAVSRFARRRSSRHND